MDVTKLATHIIFVGGREVKFLANSVNLSADSESYVFSSFPDKTNFTVLEPVRKSDIAFISIETKSITVPDEPSTPPTPEPTQDQDDQNAS